MICVGIQLYTVLEQLQKDPEATLARLAEIGYREIEALGWLLASGIDFRNTMERLNLVCPSVHLPFGTEETEMLLEEACSLGAQYVVSPVLFPSDCAGVDVALMHRDLNNMVADDFKNIAEKANEIGSRARRKGLRYAYHNHEFEFRKLDSGLNGYSILLANTDPDLVYFEADCGWMAVAGVSPVELLRCFPGRFPLLHLKDFNLNGSADTSIEVRSRSTALGQGQIDYRTLLWQAIELSTKHMFVEREPPPPADESLEAAAKDYHYVESILSSGVPRQ